MDYNDVIGFFIDNIKKIVFPEEWLDIDLSFSKHEVFAMLLVDKQEEIIMSQIANYLNIPMSTATGIIDRLVKSGYLYRDRSESDRRIVVIKLTDKGREFTAEIKNKINKYVRMIQTGLTEDEQKYFFRIIIKIFDLLKAKPADNTNVPEETDTVKKINIE